MKDYTKVSIIIPSFEPTDQLLNVVKGLSTVLPTNRIIVVNDGSGAKYESYFEAIKSFPQVTLLEHSKNKGKGRALKTAFEYQLAYFFDLLGAVTADSDGQHTTEDIEKLVRATAQADGKSVLILGVRNFQKESTPAKSYFGNRLTASLLNNLEKENIKDTQTGLRGIPQVLLSELLKISGERFEYEMNMLLDARKIGYKIEQIPIQTIYENGNHGTHFHPIRDSLLVYGRFIRFVLCSLTSAVADIGLFTLFLFLLGAPTGQHLFIATFLGRVLSGVVNYTLNRTLVFKENNQGSKFSYAGLFVIQLTLSYVFVYLLTHFTPIYPTIVKMIVDTSLFFGSYLVQKTFIFIRKKEHKVV